MPKTSVLNPAGALQDADFFPIIQENETKRIDFLAFKNAIRQTTFYHGVDTSSYSGDLLSLNIDPTKIDIKPFTYAINGTQVSFVGATAYSGFTFTRAGDFYTIGIDNTGSIVSTKNNFFTPQQLETILELGALISTNGTNITHIGDSHFDYNELEKNVAIWAKFGKRTDFIGNACLITESATPLRLAMSGGDIITPALHRKDVTALNPISNVVLNYHSAGVYITANATNFTVDVVNYDNGTSLTTLGNNKWASHTLLRSSRTGAIYFVYSQGEYANSAEAIDSDVNLGQFTQLGSDVEPIAKIVVEKNTVSINYIIDLRNNITSTAVASGIDLQNAYDRSGTPQITLAPTKPFQIANDVGDTNTVLRKVTNNDGTVTFEELGVDKLRLFTNADLANSTIYHKLQLDGYILHKKGWKDYTIDFGLAGTGANAPLLVTDSIGFQRLAFRTNDEIFQNIHVNHDYSLGTLSYPHVHWAPTTTMTAGQTVVWQVTYTIAKGHQQGESILSNPITFTLTHTSDGTEVVCEHMVTECSVAQAFDLKEPDTLVSFRFKRIAGTYTGDIYGLFGDIHFESDTEVTKNKAPNFNIDN